MKQFWSTLAAALILSSASAFATGAGGLLIATSEALEKEIVLFSAECGKIEQDPTLAKDADALRECASDKATLVKRLLEFAKFCDELAALGYSDNATPKEVAQMQVGIAAEKLQARIARFYAKYMGVAPKEAAGIAEAKAISKEQSFLLTAEPDSTFATVGLLSDESMEWIITGTKESELSK